MIVSRLFGFPSEEKLFEKAYNILKSEFGLVDGYHYSSTGKQRVLVWEDEKGVGRWRVSLESNQKSEILGNGDDVDVILFRYWMNCERFDKNVMLRDPMRQPLERILMLSKNRYDTDHLLSEAGLEALEKYMIKEVT